VAGISAAGWLLVAFSAIAHFIYQIFLCRAYELGDMSLSYPIMRSSPVFVLILGVLFLGEKPSVAAIAGVLVVAFGAHVINQKELTLKAILTPIAHANRLILAIAGLTAFSSACYSIVDKKGVLSMEPVLFFYLFFALSGFLFLAYLLFFKEKRKRYFEVSKRDIFKVTLASILEFSSYILILYAFRISKVAYVVALRQLSVVFGAAYGIWFLKEDYGRVRLAGSIIIFIGMFLITVFG